MTATVTATEAPAPAPEAKGPLPWSTRFVAWILAAVGVLALWAVLYPLVIGALQENDSQHQLFAKLRSQLSQATAPLGPTSLGKPVAILDAPQADLDDVVVVEGTASHELQSGPGHERDTVLPGQAGTSVLLGKCVTFGGPFHRITDLEVGDAIKVTTGQGTFTYVVERTRRAGDSVAPPLTNGQGRLTLGTVEGRGWRGDLAPTSIVYVDALLKGTAQPSPGGLPRGTVKGERPFGVSTDALSALVLWLEALLIVVLGGTWLGGRWGKWRTWAVMLPVLLAVGIGTSGCAAQMLPNLL